MKKLLKLTFTDITKRESLEQYDIAWVRHAFSKMELQSNLKEYRLETPSDRNANVYSNYQNAVSALLSERLGEKSDGTLLYNIKRSYLARESEDSTSEVLAAALEGDKDNTEFLGLHFSHYLNQIKDIEA